MFARPEERTCLVVSHRPAVLRRADQVLLMDTGRAIAYGGPDEVLEDSFLATGMQRGENVLLKGG
jgi:ABC-type multidrug transport system fused ATPase/permease subunit